MRHLLADLCIRLNFFSSPYSRGLTDTIKGQINASKVMNDAVKASNNNSKASKPTSKQVESEVEVMSSGDENKSLDRNPKIQNKAQGKKRKSEEPIEAPKPQINPNQKFDMKRAKISTIDKKETTKIPESERGKMSSKVETPNAPVNLRKVQIGRSNF